eukprot:SAG22_NODE_6269_length_877_cov_0.857326_1_plen_217_part_10
MAFKAAAAARGPGSKVKLFYNDYSAEPMNAKSDKVYNLVKGMQSRGVPIDGVGLQFHVSVENPPSLSGIAANMARLGKLGLEVRQADNLNLDIHISAATTAGGSDSICICVGSTIAYRTFHHQLSNSNPSSCSALACLPDTQVHITEMDLKCPAEGCSLVEQARLYAAILEVCLAAPSCKVFESWGFTDGDSWIGTAQRPLPFDTAFKPKPAVDALI